MTDKELTEWEHQSHVITVLTSREMGAWLGRRDSRLLQEIRQEIADRYENDGLYFNSLKFALEIIDKRIKEIEGEDI